MSGAIFEIGGTAAALQAELAKIPGMTDRAAAAAAVKLSAPLIKAQRDVALAAAAAQAAATEGAAATLAAEQRRAAVLETIPASLREAAAATVAVTAAEQERAAALGITVAKYQQLQAAELAAANAAKQASSYAATMTPALQKAAAASTTVARSAAGEVAALGTAGAQAGARNVQALVGVGQQLSDVASQLATGTNPLTILVQQGPQVAYAMSMAEGGIAGFAATLAPMAAMIAPVALAAAALGAAYVALKHDLDEAEASMRRASEAASAMQEAHAAQEGILDDVRQRIALLTGETTKEAVAVEREQRRWTEAREEGLKLAEARVEAAKSAYEHGVATEVERTELFAAQASLAAYQDKTATVSGQIAILVEEELKAAGGHREHAKAVKELYTELEHLSDLMQGENDLARDNATQYRDALSALGAIRAEYGGQATAIQAADEARRASLATIADELRAARAVTAEGTAAREEAERAALDAMREANAQYYADVAAARAIDAKEAGKTMRAETARLQAELEKRGAADQAALTARLEAERGAYASMFGSIGDAFGLMYSEMDGLSKRQAKALFAAQKAAQIAQALVLAPAAILQGLAQAGPAGGIAAGVAAGVQVAAIAAADPPSFRAGGEVSSRRAGGAVAGAYPDVVPISAEAGEGVVTRQGMANRGGADGLGRQNAGMGSGGSLTVNLVIDHKTAARIVLDALGDAGVRTAITRAVRPTLNSGAR